MKKIMSIIVLAASLIAALVVFVCESPKFDNPLDEKGDNFLEGRDSAKAHKDEALKTDDNGVAEFWTDETEKFRPNCDEVTPTVALVGANPVNITTLEVQEFRKWMRFDGGPWSALITYTKGANGKTDPVPEEPCLTRAGASCISFSEQDKNKTPAANNYIIQYKVKKPLCRGDTPQAMAQRTLNVTQYVAADTGTPVITLLGGATAEVRVGSTYQDLGVTVTVNGLNTPTALDSVVVKGIWSASNTYRLKVEKPNGVFTAVVLPPTLVAKDTFSITYYASYKGASMTDAKTDYKVRKVAVLEQPVSNVTPVIVLVGYKHKLKNGTVIDGYPDTMLYVGSTNDNYKEKGVEKVYYIKDGAEVAVDKSLVTTKNPSPFITNQTSWATKTVNYDLAADSGYAPANAKRNVYLVDNDCEKGKIEPEVKTSGSSEIQAGAVWNYNGSWSVTNKDELGNGSAGFKYFIHFNGLNPNNPKAGTYKITYVGLGRCGGTAELERTITVK